MPSHRPGLCTAVAIRAYSTSKGASGAQAVNTYQAAKPPVGAGTPADVTAAGLAAARWAGAMAHHASHSSTSPLHIGVSQPRRLNCAGPTTSNREAATSRPALTSDNTSNCQGVGAAAAVRCGRNSAARRPSRIQPHSDKPSAAAPTAASGTGGCCAGSCCRRFSGTSTLEWVSASSGPHWLGKVSAQVLLLAFRSFMRGSCH